MEKESNASRKTQKSKNENAQTKNDPILEKKKLPNIINKQKSTNLNFIKVSRPIKHFSSLQDAKSSCEVIDSNLNTPFKINKENAFGYRILFEAFFENIDKKKNSDSQEQNNPMFLGKYKIFYIVYFIIIKFNN